MSSKYFKLTPMAIACALAWHTPSFAQDAVLPTITVKSGADKAVVPESNRLGVSLKETPQSVTVVDADLIRAQNATNINEVVTNVPGAISGISSGGEFRNIFLRGFMVDNVNNFMRDGMRFDRMSQPSLQNIEQVEVVRGPASMQYGKLAPGGFVNLVTKKPQAKFGGSATAYVDRFGQLEGGFDITGKATESGSVLYRFNAEAKRLESFRDHVDGKSYFIAPAFTFVLSKATTLDLSYEHSTVDQVGDPGQPTLDGATVASSNNLAPDLFYGEEDATRDTRSDTVTAHLKHRLNDAWELRADHIRGRFKRDVYQTSNWVVDTNAQLLERKSLPYFADQRSSSTRFEAGGNFTTGGFKHKLITGVDYFTRTVRNRDGQLADIASVSLVDPQQVGNTFFDTTVLDPVNGESRSAGLYLQDYVEFGKWGMMAGGRYDRLKDEVGTVSQSDSKFSPSAGVMFHVLPTLSLYASYSQSFESNVGSDAAGNMFDPSLGKQYEIGAKGTAFGQNLNWSVATYDLRKTNVQTRDPANPTRNIQTGEQRSKGVEIEVSGRVTRSLRLHGAYSYMDAEITKDNRFTVGSKLRHAPEHSARLWTEYTFDDALQGWSASLGATYLGERFGQLNDRLEIPSSLIWDAGARYAITNQDTLQFAVMNLTDRRYAADALDTETVYPGAPRTVSVRYTRTF